MLQASPIRDYANYDDDDDDDDVQFRDGGW